MFSRLHDIEIEPGNNAAIQYPSSLCIQKAVVSAPIAVDLQGHMAKGAVAASRKSNTVTCVTITSR